jgi:type II secretory pathway component PulL
MRLYLRFFDEQLDYWLGSEAGVCQMSGTAFHPDQMPEFPKGVHTTLIIPGQLVTHRTLTLPKTSNSQLKKALPFALADDVMTDISLLHFVLQPQKKNGEVGVFIIEKTLLKTLLERALALGVFVDRALPDYECIPPLDNAWHLYAEGQSLHVRFAESGLTVANNLAENTLKVLLSNEENKPASLYVDYDDGQEDIDLSYLADKGIVIDYATTDTRAMDLFVNNLQKNKGQLNLLQDEFYPKKTTLAYVRFLRLFFILIFSWIGIALVMQGIHVFRLSRAVSQNQITINALTASLAQGNNTVSDPRAFVQKQLQAITQDNQRTELLNWLYYVSTALAPLNDKVSIDNFTYNNHRLTLSLSASDFTVLGNMKNSLTQAGLLVTQDNASTEGDKVKARLIITAGGST